MISDSDAIVTLPARDLARAKSFYKDVIGLELVDDKPNVATFRSGGSNVLVYETENAGSNTATAATWAVHGLDDVVRQLKSKGATFEHYDNLPGLKIEGDVHVGHGMRVAWLKDPDGNILSLYDA